MLAGTFPGRREDQEIISASPISQLTTLVIRSAVFHCEDNTENIFLFLAWKVLAELGTYLQMFWDGWSARFWWTNSACTHCTQLNSRTSFGLHRLSCSTACEQSLILEADLPWWADEQCVVYSVPMINPAGLNQKMDLPQVLMRCCWPCSAADTLHFNWMNHEMSCCLWEIPLLLEETCLVVAFTQVSHKTAWCSFMWLSKSMGPERGTCFNTATQKELPELKTVSRKLWGLLKRFYSLPYSILLPLFPPPHLLHTWLLKADMHKCRYV